jgi:integrase
MTTTTPSALVPAAPVFTNTERLALAGFLAGYSGLTREAYELDLRQYASWCHQHHLRLFQARRADIECFARDLETRGRARATITRRLCTVAGFYRYAVEEDLLDHSPAAHVRRPRLDYESHATGLDRNELGALLVAAGLGTAGEHALISLLALNGLRVSEATGADIEALGVERGHRTLVVTRKGGMVVTVPLAPRTARAIDLAVGERRHGTGLPVRRWPPVGPARRWTDRPPGGPPRRDHQTDRSAHAAARVHHRRAGRRGPATRRAGSRLARRSPNHHEIRPGQRNPGPARHLHRRRLRRRCRPVRTDCPARTPPGRSKAARRRPVGRVEFGAGPPQLSHLVWQLAAR